MFSTVSWNLNKFIPVLNIICLYMYFEFVIKIFLSYIKLIFNFSSDQALHILHRPHSFLIEIIRRRFIVKICLPSTHVVLSFSTQPLTQLSFQHKDYFSHIHLRGEAKNSCHKSLPQPMIKPATTKSQVRYTSNLATLLGRKA